MLGSYSKTLPPVSPGGCHGAGRNDMDWDFACSNGIIVNGCATRIGAKAY